MDTLAYLYLAQENEDSDSRELTLNPTELSKWVTTGVLGIGCTVGVLSIADSASACYRPCRPLPHPVQHHFRNHHSYYSNDYSYEDDGYSGGYENSESYEDGNSDEQPDYYEYNPSSAATTTTAQGLAAARGSASQGSGRFGSGSLASASRSRGQYFSPQGSASRGGRQMSMRGTPGSTSRTPGESATLDSPSTTSATSSSAASTESFTEPSDSSSYSSDYLYHGNDGVASIGYYGEIVTAAQQKLKDLGYYQGAVDSQFGSLTYDAVVAYQTDTGLQVDGIIGPETRASLGI